VCQLRKPASGRRAVLSWMWVPGRCSRGAEAESGDFLRGRGDESSASRLRDDAREARGPARPWLAVACVPYARFEESAGIDLYDDPACACPPDC
jgi:hypothetical protein